MSPETHKQEGVFFPQLVVRIQEAGCGLGVSTHACKSKPGNHAPWLTGTGSLAEQRLTWCPGAQDQEICFAGSSAVLLIKQQKKWKKQNQQQNREEKLFKVKWLSWGDFRCLRNQSMLLLEPTHSWEQEAGG